MCFVGLGSSARLSLELVFGTFALGGGESFRLISGVILGEFFKGVRLGVLMGLKLGWFKNPMFKFAFLNVPFQMIALKKYITFKHLHSIFFVLIFLCLI